MQQVWQIPVGRQALGDRFVYRDVRLSRVADAHLVTALVDSLLRVSALGAWWDEHPVDLVYVPREPGPWSHAARLLAEHRSVRVRTLRSVPPRVPLWPPQRRSVTQYLPAFLTRWREKRQADEESRTLARRRARLPQRGDVDVLAAAHYVGEVRALEPIIRRMDADGEHSVALCVDEWGAGKDVSRDAGLLRGVMQDLGGWRESARRVRRASGRLGRLWRRALRRTEARAIRHCGVPVPSIMEGQWRVLSDVSRRHDCLRQYLWWIEMMDRVLDHWSPRLLLLADEAMPPSVIRLELAEARGIPTVHVQHGAMPDHPKHHAGRATRITVGGEAIRRFLVSRGTDPERVVATGAPQFDPLADHAALDASPARAELGIPDGRPVVLYTMLSGLGVTPREDVIAATHEVLAARRALGEDATFVFKRHPGDRGDILSQMVEEQSGWV